MTIADPEARSAPRSGSVAASVIAKLVAVCGVIPYALVALGLRFVMARVFFLSGQTMIDGPSVSFTWINPRFTFSAILPAQVKEATFQMFQTEYAGLPLPPVVAAYVFAYALFVLPICLMLGFATRLAALALLVMTVLLAVYVTPDALWTAHAYWYAILLTLMTVGPGAISIDAGIKYVHER